MLTAIVEVIIGIVFVFLLMSLIVTSVMEWVNQFLGLRAKNLFKGVKAMLQDPNARSMADLVMKHPLIQATASPRRGVSGIKLPSYIEPHTFRLALMTEIHAKWSAATGVAQAFPATVAEVETMITGARLAPDLEKSLVTVVRDAHGAIENLEKGIESWFDASMDRVGGWYKRELQRIMLIIGVGFAAILNVDPVRIAAWLYDNPALRGVIVAQAMEYVDEHKFEHSVNPAETGDDGPKPGATTSGENQPSQVHGLEQVKGELESLGLPIGWTSEFFGEFHHRRWYTVLSMVLSTCLGWLVTGLATSLGAPFWFDLLSKLASIRATGSKPETNA